MLRVIEPTALFWQADGHSYERIAIEEWLEKNETSPMTNENLSHQNLVPNHALRQIIIEQQDRDLAENSQHLSNTFKRSQALASKLHGELPGHANETELKVPASVGSVSKHMLPVRKPCAPKPRPSLDSWSHASQARADHLLQQRKLILARRKQQDLRKQERAFVPLPAACFYLLGSI